MGVLGWESEFFFICYFFTKIKTKTGIAAAILRQKKGQRFECRHWSSRKKIKGKHGADKNEKKGMVMHAGVTGWTDVESEGLKERVGYMLPI